MSKILAFLDHFGWRQVWAHVRCWGELDVFWTRLILGSRSERGIPISFQFCSVKVNIVANDVSFLLQFQQWPNVSPSANANPITPPPTADAWWRPPVANSFITTLKSPPQLPSAVIVVSHCLEYVHHYSRWITGSNSSLRSLPFAPANTPSFPSVRRPYDEHMVVHDVVTVWSPGASPSPPWATFLTLVWPAFCGHFWLRRRRLWRRWSSRNKRLPLHANRASWFGADSMILLHACMYFHDKTMTEEVICSPFEFS